MNVIAQVCALIAAAIHLVVGLLESFFYDRPAVRRFLTLSEDNPPALRLWTFNVGFYNIFLAAGLIAGLVAAWSGHESVGRALVIYVSAFMVAGGIMLFVSDRRLWQGSLGQGLLPLVALVTLLV
ncbi:DUF1304 domain-containing protein [Streptomyces sp. TRM64462]|uniref:DUF1304 domain-containing protein n=1 Tax=Streptomyces sp. TRM64462 TaxID=2741726 RepID=UPI001586245F|nr:DUF1304 domain-containing protein [Streptomyces sp. TRM64462]